jgi:hypothetical protein
MLHWNAPVLVKAFRDQRTVARLWITFDAEQYDAVNVGVE